MSGDGGDDRSLLAWGLFARGLALVQAFALLDLSRQVLAFSGRRGIKPVHVTLRKLRAQLDRPALRWRYAPSLLWLSDSDAALRGRALAGLALPFRYATMQGSAPPESKRRRRGRRW